MVVLILVILCGSACVALALRDRLTRAGAKVALALAAGSLGAAVALHALFLSELTPQFLVDPFGRALLSSVLAAVAIGSTPFALIGLFQR